MAFTPYVRARALVSALGMFRQVRHVLSFDEVVARIRARFDPFNRQSFFTVYNLVRSARNILDQGTDMTDNPTQRFGARVTPRDPSIRPGEQRYLYRVIVQQLDGAGQVTQEMLVLVPSDKPMSGAEALNAAFDAYRAAQPPGNSPRSTTARIPTAPLQGLILTGGQAP